LNTLASPPVSPLLDQLFALAAAQSPFDGIDQSQLTPSDIQALMTSKTRYIELYTHLRHAALPVSRETGKLLYMLARSSRARAIVEFGTSIGISTLHLAAALRDNGGGQLITAEFEPSKITAARRHLSEAGLADLVDVREGDALATFATGLPSEVDLLLLDGAKAIYRDVLQLVEPRLHPGSIIVADNADRSPDYLEYLRMSGNRYFTLPFTTDVELTIFTG
jgi:predicted O-methyltransferase YrrM